VCITSCLTGKNQLAVVLSIYFSISFSFWWLTLLIFYPIFNGAAKLAYNDEILGSALYFEKGFSFLFSRGAICLLSE